jgi:beta-phosphoglucomutase-like phosphatase (HAD superfamily)
MPNNAVTRGLEAPQLVVMDLLGVFMENDHAVKGAIAAAFQAHGERVDEDLAATAIGFLKTQGIERVLRWLHPMEQPHQESVRSIYDLAVKEMTRVMTYGGDIEPSAGSVRLCEQWHKCGAAVAAVSTLDSAVVKVMLRRFGWDEQPPLHTLVLAEEFNSENPTSDVIEECMRRLDVSDVSAVAKVSTRAKGLVDAMKLGCGWKVLLDP